MTVYQPDQCMQTGLLDAGCVGHRQIDAGAEPFVEDLSGRSDLLAAVLEGGRRRDVTNLLGPQCLIAPRR